MLYEYMSARDLFDAARAAAMECERTRRMLLAMESTEAIAGHGMTERVRSGSVPDPMRRTDARIDRERMWSARIEENERLIDLCHSILYGREQNGKGGVCALLGSVYADALWWHYLACETWARTGEMVGYSVTRCKDMRDVALDLVDTLGLPEVIDGIGFAEG